MLLRCRLPQIVLIEGVVALERRHRFRPRDLHGCEGVYPGPAHIGHGRMPEVMKVKVGEARFPACPVERTPDALHGLPVAVEDMAGGTAYR